MTSSLIIVGLAFGLYGWLSTVVVGVAFLQLLPTSTLTRYGLALYRPLGLVSLLLLILGSGGYGILMPASAQLLYHKQIVLFIIALISLSAQVALIFFRRIKGRVAGISWDNLLTIVSTYSLPLSIGGIVIYGLTGHSFWTNSTTWSLMIALFLGITALTSSFFFYIVGLTPHGRTKSIARIISVVFGAFVTLLVQRSVSHHEPHLLGNIFFGYMALVAVILIMQAILYVLTQERYMWFYLSVLGVITPPVFLLTNRPFAVFPSVIFPVNSSTSVHLVFLLLLPVTLLCAGYTIYVLVLPPSARRER